jgi:hypothetical protein
MEISIVKNYGTPLLAAQNNKLAYVNYLGANLWYNINVKLNVKSVSDHSHLHQLRFDIMI